MKLLLVFALAWWGRGLLEEALGALDYNSTPPLSNGATPFTPITSGPH